MSSLSLSACFQVHPGGLACGSDHYEGFHQPDVTCDGGLRGPLLDFAIRPQGSPSVIRNRLHGHLHTVRLHTCHGLQFLKRNVVLQLHFVLKSSKHLFSLFQVHQQRNPDHT